MKNGERKKKVNFEGTTEFLNVWGFQSLKLHKCVSIARPIFLAVSEPQT